MIILKQNLGVDVDSRSLKVSFQKIDNQQHIKIKGSRTFSNTAKGFEELLKWVNSKKDDSKSVHVTMEATGVYYENLAYFFYEQKDYIVHVVLPNKSVAYFKSLNAKSKTDQIDAKLLGHMGLERKLEQWIPGSSQMRLIKKLSRERLRIQTEKVMVSNQLHAEKKSYMPSLESVKRYEERIEFLAQQMTAIEKELKTKVNQDEELKEKIDNVCTAKGIRFITAIGVVAEMDGFALFKNRNQVVSYGGYDVVKRESGQAVFGKTKISKKGNSIIRKLLYFPALSAAQHDEHHKKYYERVVDNTKIPMKGCVAIQRKLLLLIYTLYRRCCMKLKKKGQVL